MGLASAAETASVQLGQIVRHSSQVQEQLGWESGGEVQYFTPALHQAELPCTDMGLLSAVFR